MSQLIFTNELCVGCNRCIGACSCQGANIVKNERGKNVVQVDEERCIACGACFDVCEHKARSYNDDTERFFADLKKYFFNHSVVGNISGIDYGNYIVNRFLCYFRSAEGGNSVKPF